MTTELMRDFSIGAASLGNLSAFYFYFYVAMQIPVGALTNSWGARKLLITCAVLAAGGQFLFGATSNFAVACAGRALVSACCWTGTGRVRCSTALEFIARLPIVAWALVSCILIALTRETQCRQSA
jgi:MFS family permease